MTITSSALSKLKKQFREAGPLYIATQDGKKLEYSRKEDLFEDLLDLSKKQYITYTIEGKIHEKVVSFRTLEDLFRIVSYYFPRVTLNSFIKYIWVRSSWRHVCKMIKKRTYRRHSSVYEITSTPSDAERNKQDEFGWTWNDYNNFINGE